MQEICVSLEQFENIYKLSTSGWQCLENTTKQILYMHPTNTNYIEPIIPACYKHVFLSAPESGAQTAP